MKNENILTEARLKLITNIIIVHMVTICEFPLDIDVLFDLMDISARLKAATLINYVLSQRNFPRSRLKIVNKNESKY